MNMSEKHLSSKHCVPCEGGIAPLTPEQIEPFRNQISGEWEIGEHKKIRREFRFGDFHEAMRFVDRVAELAEQENHHPDIEIHWNKVALTLWTHVIEGLSENDFILASKIDQLA